MEISSRRRRRRRPSRKLIYKKATLDSTTLQKKRDKKKTKTYSSSYPVSVIKQIFRTLSAAQNPYITRKVWPHITISTCLVVPLSEFDREPPRLLLPE